MQPGVDEELPSRPTEGELELDIEKNIEGLGGAPGNVIPIQTMTTNWMMTTMVATPMTITKSRENPLPSSTYPISIYIHSVRHSYKQRDSNSFKKPYLN